MNKKSIIQTVYDIIEKHMSKIDFENVYCTNLEDKKKFQTTHKIWYDTELEDSMILDEIEQTLNIDLSDLYVTYGMSDKEIIEVILKKYAKVRI